mgnify:CR=1 FL=1
MYYKRVIENKINEIKNEYAVITVYGARQVGKSTMINHLFQNIKMISLDDLEMRTLANNNPKLFLETYSWPIIIDEVQKATPLLSYIKLIVDEEKKKVVFEDKKLPLMYILTGSNQFELQEAINESLAGRTAIFNMASLSKNEKYKIEMNNEFNPDIKVLKDKARNIDVKNAYSTRTKIFEDIFYGGMPEYIIEKKDRETFFRSYIQTYIEKDVRKAIGIDKERQFLLFLEYLALRTAQQINYEDISKNIGIDARTVKNWISILKASGIIILIEPYAKNLSDRIIKTPKLYFMDTGLCAYLCKWPTANMLEKCAMNGAFYETYAVSEIIKSYINKGLKYDNTIYYYRDKTQKEVDLIFEYFDYIIPIEIKKGINPVSSSFNFNFLRKYGKEIKKGIVIDSREDIFPINEFNWYCPIYMIGY